jgi:hypothetical protein
MRSVIYGVLKQSHQEMGRNCEPKFDLKVLWNLPFTMRWRGILQLAMERLSGLLLLISLKTTASDINLL